MVRFHGRDERILENLTPAFDSLMGMLVAGGLPGFREAAMQSHTANQERLRAIFEVGRRYKVSVVGSPGLTR